MEDRQVVLALQSPSFTQVRTIQAGPQWLVSAELPAGQLSGGGGTASARARPAISASTAASGQARSE